MGFQRTTKREGARKSVDKNIAHIPDIEWYEDVSPNSEDIYRKWKPYGSIICGLGFIIVLAGIAASAACLILNSSSKHELPGFVVPLVLIITGILLLIACGCCAFGFQVKRFHRVDAEVKETMQTRREEAWARETTLPAGRSKSFLQSGSLDDKETTEERKSWDKKDGRSTKVKTKRERQKQSRKQQKSEKLTREKTVVTILAE